MMKNAVLSWSGLASVELPQKGAQRSKKISLHKGEIFGEIAVLSGNPRTADIVTSRPCIILNLDKNSLFQLFDNFPLVKNRLNKLYCERALSSHLLTIPIFSGIPEKFLENLVNKVTLHSFRKGETVFKQDDVADAFYLVRYGFVKVSETIGEKKERVLAYLKDGHYFGEMALLKDDEKRMATVTAINRIELIKILRKDFQKLLEAYPSVKANLEKVVEKRKERNVQISKDLFLEGTLSSAIESGIIQSKAILIMDQTKCVHCNNCVNACAALHDNHSRLVRKGSMFNNFILIPTSCRHCEDPTCMSECPTGAITRGYDGEVFHKDFCVGCGNCAKNCPFGNISVVSLSDGNEGKFAYLSGFLSNLFKRKDNGNSKETALGSGKKARFSFPGERDMVQLSSSKKFPGDRDMTANFDNTREANKGNEKKGPRRKAVKCDMCRDFSFLGCVYNCPVGAARRVDPSELFYDISTVG